MVGVIIIIMFIGLNRVWAVIYGHNYCVWAQTCVGTNVCGNKRVWALTHLGTSVPWQRHV